jgi:hypothetical protein
MNVTKRTSRQWYDEAVRWYVEKHQGCPWCGGSHRVYRLVRGTKETYTCQGCDFQASFDAEKIEYNHIIGEGTEGQTAPTMYDF